MEIAKMMLVEGMTTGLIAKITGLSEEEIKELQAEREKAGK